MGNHNKQEVKIIFKKPKNKSKRVIISFYSKKHKYYINGKKKII